MGFRFSPGCVCCGATCQYFFDTFSDRAEWPDISDRWEVVNGAVVVANYTLQLRGTDEDFVVPFVEQPNGSPEMQVRAIATVAGTLRVIIGYVNSSNYFYLEAQSAADTIRLWQVSSGTPSALAAAVSVSIGGSQHFFVCYQDGTLSGGIVDGTTTSAVATVTGLRGGLAVASGLQIVDVSQFTLWTLEDECGTCEVIEPALPCTQFCDDNTTPAAMKLIIPAGAFDNGLFGGDCTCSDMEGTHIINQSPVSPCVYPKSFTVCPEVSPPHVPVIHNIVLNKISTGWRVIVRVPRIDPVSPASGCIVSPLSQFQGESTKDIATDSDCQNVSETFTMPQFGIPGIECCVWSTSPSDTLTLENV